MADQYRVDLSELDSTITKLNRIIGAMGKTSTDAKHTTHLPSGALGASFTEAHQLEQAHAEMKAHLEEIVEHLHEVMDAFGTKAKKVHDNYQNSEYEAQSSMSGTS
ncbi:MAG: hypothetical protein QOF84_539 [Streptomyces sp.]|jgi:hypothetical protein|nr:hypothetical protein [Streptomyces sp.]MDX6345749.1 hypothetical protein [Streptomyces sp.]